MVFSPRDLQTFLMSRLLAINYEALENYRDIQSLFWNIGYQKSYLLAQIPSSIESKLKEKIISLNISSDNQYKLMTQLAEFQQRKEIYNFGLKIPQSNFNTAIKEFYAKDKRLSLAVSNISEKPLKKIDDLTPDDFPGPDSFDAGNLKEDSLADSFWKYIEFQARTAAKIALVGRNNYLFGNQNKKTNLAYILEKVFKELKSGARCEEFLIYCSPKNIEQIKSQSQLIINFFNSLKANHKPKYGIKYLLMSEHTYERNTDLHQRFFLTNYSAITMGDELGNPTRSLYQVITDNTLISSLHDYWLEQKHGLDLLFEIS
jgi:hypothetical protein